MSPAQRWRSRCARYTVAVMSLSPPAAVRRVAVLSVHTSPLDQPGIGDAGGLNVYVTQTALHLARRGIEVDIFTRATSSAVPAVVPLADGVAVHHVDAGPLQPLPKGDLPAQLCALTSGVLRAESQRPEGWYDLIHSHYWLSGHVGWLATERWRVPLVHTMHTMARVKNNHLAGLESPEPSTRVIGEQQIVAIASRLIANTEDEAGELVSLYAADPAKISVVNPGVDLDVFHPGSSVAARASLGVSPDALLLTFVGRIQPLKAPDVLIRAASELSKEFGRRLAVVVCGGDSGDSGAGLQELRALADALGISEQVTFLPPRPPQDVALLYRASDLVIVPSYSESFGLVALEAQACGVPVVAAAVGGLRTAVRDGVSGVLVSGHDSHDWARAIADLLRDGPRRQRMSDAAVLHALAFSWDESTSKLVAAYEETLAASQRPSLL
ncbi:MAG: D-inositol-3-phosphate glycosyltransferase [Actinobacteria bacterium]|nr:D-inositol-3-phosphate glycosyltransferase [Actinomycetota bacterium]